MSKKQKKTIVILSDHDIWTYKCRKEVIHAMLAEDYKVVLVLPYGEKVEAMKTWGCEFIDLQALSRHNLSAFGEIKLINEYRKILKSVKPDVVLAYTIKPNLYGGLVTSWLKIPFIASITGLGMALQKRGLLSTVIKLMYSMWLRNAECIFAQNTDIKKFLEDRKLPSKIRVVPGSGVNVEQHCFEKYPKVNPDTIFVTIGRLMKDKGIDELLEAAKQIKREYPNTRFQLIGFDDGDYQKIVEEAEKEGIVEYLGYQDDVHHWITKSHAIVHPSYHEGMANVLLESASAGRPIIATDIPGCRETFEDGVSGIGFKVQNTSALVGALREFIELPYEQKVAMGKAGREKMEKEFDRNIVVEAYLQEIRRITD